MIEHMFPLQDETAIVGLRAQLAAAVSALDLDCCLPSAAERLVNEGEQIERLGQVIKTLAAARVVEAGAWNRDGAHSPADWLASKTGTSKGDAADTLTTGQQLKDLPATQDAMRKGKLSRRQAQAVADAAAADPSAEGRLLDRAERGSLGELQNEARRTKAAADLDPEGTRKRIHAARSLRHWVDPSGTGHLHATGTPDSIARIAARVSHRASKVFDRARKVGKREPLEAYAFDALDELTNQEGSGPGLPVGAEAKIIVRVDHAALVRRRVEPGETCEIVGMGPIPVSVVDEWMADAFVAAVLTEGEDVTKVVHLGRKFTARQKTALQWRDPECCVQGCTNTARLEYDHDDPWADTHTTTVTSGDRLCKLDHKRKTAGWYLAAAEVDGKRPLLSPEHPDHPFRAAIRARRQTCGADPPLAG